MRNQIKKFRSVTGLVNALRALPGDLRLARCAARQTSQLARYCATHPVRKLHLGCGHNLLDGWLNADISPEYSCVLYLDATDPLPIADATFDYIYSEHAHQYFTYATGQTLLAECRRILKPDGVLRLATPDLQQIASLLTSREGATQKEYTRLVSDKYLRENTSCLPALVVNNFYWGFRHVFVHDEQTLRHTLAGAGFSRVIPVRSGESADPSLAALEQHGLIVGDRINEFETMIFEARK